MHAVHKAEIKTLLTLSRVFFFSIKTTDLKFTYLKTLEKDML